ncbi:hypothetical protein Ahia01_000740000 [Argonauta hians]
MWFLLFMLTLVDVCGSAPVSMSFCTFSKTNAINEKARRRNGKERKKKEERHHQQQHQRQSMPVASFLTTLVNGIVKGPSQLPNDAAENCEFHIQSFQQQQQHISVRDRERERNRERQTQR